MNVFNLFFYALYIFFFYDLHQLYSETHRRTKMGGGAKGATSHLEFCLPLPHLFLVTVLEYNMLCISET